MSDHEVIVETESISQQFGGLRALEDVSISISKGSIQGIIGPNGAGKTTFLNILSGWQSPSSGRVLVEGIDTTNWSTRKIVTEAGIARTFQTARMFSSMTVFEHVLLASGIKSQKDSASKAHELIERFGLTGVAYGKAAMLAYGLQRRVELARAMATEPKVLLLDEPAAGLNGSERTELGSHLRAIAKEGLAIILVEHQMDLVHSVCKEITVLNFGKVISQGAIEKVMNDPQVIEAYLGIRHTNQPNGDVQDE